MVLSLLCFSLKLIILLCQNFADIKFDHSENHKIISVSRNKIFRLTKQPEICGELNFVLEQNLSLSEKSFDGSKLKDISLN